MSYELAVVQLLSRGSADDMKEVQASINGARTDAFGDDYLLKLESAPSFNKRALIWPSETRLHGFFGLFAPISLFPLPLPLS